MCVFVCAPTGSFACERLDFIFQREALFSGPGYLSQVSLGSVMEEVSANKAAKYTCILAQQKGYVDLLFSAGCVLMHTYK